ncbi:hypothetical protein ASJ79_10000 [Mycobacterium sp. NAZ190054]|nr:hypothetical protein ASJ79_10000 [Mycobacterium sp. NAZ190054]
MVKIRGYVVHESVPDELIRTDYIVTERQRNVGACQHHNMSRHRFYCSHPGQGPMHNADMGYEMPSVV